MNSDPEAKIIELLAWLLQDPIMALRASSAIANASPPSTGQTLNPELNPGDRVPPSTDISAEDNGQWDELDPLDSEEIQYLTPSSSAEPNLEQSQGLSPLEGQPLEIGELPTVQDRFQALLKRRMRAEVESNLPLFPWESEVGEYYDDFCDSTVESQVPARLWMSQFRNLNLPVAIPDAVLAQLLERCQEVVQSSLREGAKLVQAVEPLFPDQSQALNQLAGMVLVSPVRSGASATPTTESGNFPSSYEAATASQQMVLSLLAARQMMSDLTLEVSPDRPVVERQWMTAEGELTLRARYQSEPNNSRLYLQAVMPCGGSLQVQADEAQVTAQRSNPGILSVELFDIVPDRTYASIVQFQTATPTPLIFAVCPTA